MTNYTRTKSFTELSSAKGADVKFEFDALATFLNTLPTAAQINSGHVTLIAAANVGGTANAITATSATSWTSFSGKDGNSVYFKVEADNTGAVTLNLNSLGAKAVKRNDGAALAAEDLQEDGFYEFIYDEDNDHFKCPLAFNSLPASATAAAASAAAALVSENAAAASETAAAASAASIGSIVTAGGGNKYAPHKDLTVNRASVSTVDIAATNVLLIDSSDDSTYLAESVSVTGVSLASSGAGGLDTGSEASDTIYYVWLIWNETTLSGLISASATAPTMPSGYTYKALVGSFFNDSSSDIVDFDQKGNVTFCRDTILSSGTATTSTALDISPVPPIANLFFAELGLENSAAAFSQAIIRDSSGNIILDIFKNPSIDSEEMAGIETFPLWGTNSVEYNVGSGTQNLDIAVVGWMV